ncbi:MAG: Transcriptional regulator, DeoR family [uncultured Thermomicrobiales bacterium]|uniref:Transcriptional regulator, DeoR family n=1 Tax=uncultured Thermomicrobiales bacterium TaxID=1645740 RepID=A0A6J4U823_9BACT|nr:MAG: Transcriptional regulator, DeoR family [uncultured Thermomicrobiales bacterium]
MRADRLLSILLLLQVHRRLTARDLAERLEVSPRTIHRDMDALSAVGVPVHAERGAGGGWVLAEPYRTDLTGLTEAELQTLFLAQPPRLLADLGLRTAAEGALVKLLAALPAARRQGAEEARQRIHVDTTGWHPSEEATPALATLQDAVWRERRLRLTYRRGDGTEVERLVDPLGLVAKGRAWYLIAGVDGEPRTYRVSRVVTAAPLEEPCVRPPGFDLVAWWERSMVDFAAGLPRYEAAVRVAPGALGWVTGPGRPGRVEAVDPPDADGWTPVRLRFDVLEEACGFALGLGPRVEVVAPTELRERVLTEARATVAFYAGRPDVAGSDHGASGEPNPGS